MSIKANVQLDAKGLACPMPIVKTKNEIKMLKPGEVLEVQATDKGSKADIAAWANSSGELYLGTIEEDDVMKHYIRKANPDEVREVSNYEKVISLNNFEKKYTDESIKLVDVREPAEYAFAHIPGSISIPLGELENRLSELKKEDDIYVICRTGNRSDFAAKLLSDKGYRNVTNVIPGIKEWSGPIKTINGGN